jgi:hypothetical protein
MKSTFITLKKFVLQQIKSGIKDFRLFTNDNFISQIEQFYEFNN